MKLKARFGVCPHDRHALFSDVRPKPGDATTDGKPNVTYLIMPDSPSARDAIATVGGCKSGLSFEPLDVFVPQSFVDQAPDRLGSTRLAEGIVPPAIEAFKLIVLHADADHRARFRGSILFRVITN